MGMGRSELRWTFSVSGMGAMTTPHLDFPGKELESLGKAETRRPSLPKVCVAETNPGRVAEDYQAPGQREWVAALMLSSEPREL